MPDNQRRLHEEADRVRQKDRMCWERRATAEAAKLHADVETMKDLEAQTKQKLQYRTKTYTVAVKTDTTLQRAGVGGLVKFQAERGAGLPFGKTTKELRAERTKAKGAKQLRRRLRRKQVVGLTAQVESQVE